MPRGHPLTTAIFPFSSSKDLAIRPIGTVFAISELGVVCTAQHNVQEAARDSWRWDQLVREWPEVLRLPDVGLCLIQRPLPGDQALRVEIPHFHAGCSSRETDLAVASIDPRIPYLPGMILPLSLTVPRVGEKLLCVGFANMSVPNKRFSMRDLRAGTFNLDRDATLPLTVTEGTVTHILTQGIGKGYPTGPCVLLDRKVDHGQSGGPVFNEQGFTCGFVGASAFFHETSAIALLYPAYMLEVQFGGPDGKPAGEPVTLRDLIRAGKISTDGNEDRIWVREDDGTITVGPRIDPDDFAQGRVFNTFADIEAKRPAEPME